MDSQLLAVLGATSASRARSARFRELGRSGGARPDEPQEGRLVADLGQVPYVALQVGLDVRTVVQVAIQIRIRRQGRDTPLAR